MQIIDYDILKGNLERCKKAGLCFEKSFFDCENKVAFDKVSCPKCKNIMTFAVNPTVDYPEYVCLVCGFNKV